MSQTYAFTFENEKRGSVWGTEETEILAFSYYKIRHKTKKDWTIIEEIADI